LEGLGDVVAEQAERALDLAAVIILDVHVVAVVRRGHDQPDDLDSLGFRALDTLDYQLGRRANGEETLAGSLGVVGELRLGLSMAVCLLALRVEAIAVLVVVALQGEETRNEITDKFNNIESTKSRNRPEAAWS
jgi:hypothetical protein